MVTTWLTIIVLVVIAFFATRKMREVPSGLQNLVEVLVEFFITLSESIADRRGRGASCRSCWPSSCS